jgi:hypothetical protein
MPDQTRVSSYEALYWGSKNVMTYTFEQNEGIVLKDYLYRKKYASDCFKYSSSYTKYIS